MKNLLFISILWWPLLVFGQRLPKPDALTIEDGLGFRNVTAIAQDSRGLMWFGTSQGLERYDGLNFIKYGNDPQADFQFPGEVVLIEGLVSRNDTSTWVVADGLLYTINTRTHSYLNLSAKAGIKGKIAAIDHAESGQLWLATDDDQQEYLYKQAGNGLKFQQVATARHLRMPFTSIACDPAGNVWWSTNAEGLRLFSPQGELLHAVQPDSFIWNNTKMHFTPVFVDSRNRVFVMPKSALEIWQYHPETGEHEVLADNLSSLVYHFLEDSQGNIWFAMKNGLLRWSQEEGHAPVITDFSASLRNALQITNIMDLYEDRTHILWVATDNGLLRFPIGKQLFKNYLTVPNVPWGNAMRGMFEDGQGSIYAFCEIGQVGLHRIAVGNADTSDISLVESLLPNRLSNGVKSFVYHKKEQAAFSISDNLLVLDLKDKSCAVAHDFLKITTQFDHNPFLELKDGTLLVGGTLANLTLYHPKSGVEKPFFKNGEQKGNADKTSVFLEDQMGNIWVGTSSQGLYCFNRNGEQLAQFSSKTKPALSKDHVLALHFDKAGRLWVGTFGGGLNRLSGDLAHPQQLTNQIFTHRQGLCDNNVVSIEEDEGGNIWAATYNGLSCYRVGEGVFRNFYEEDGLSNNEFNFTSSLRDEHGGLWFGGMNGINYFNPNDILQAEMNPPLCLTGFTKYNSKTDSTLVQVIGNQSLSEFIISPNDDWFQFSWALPNYFKPDKNHYYVRLEGLEDDWSYIGSTPFIRYNKLPAGHYILHIKGSDSKGNWSEKQLAVPIVVKPFFYQTWWFYLLVLATVGLVGYRIARYRHYRLLEMERMRTRIASDLHDEVGSMLSGLSMQAELLGMTATEKDRNRIEHIGDISRMAVSKMRDLVWSIDSRRDKVKNLLERMQEQATDLLQPQEIACQFELGELPLEKKLPVDIRQHLYLIFKEALTNITRHSDATEVKVRFGNFNGRFELSIHDNGTKTQNGKTSTGLGRSNMEMRARKLGGKLEIGRKDGFVVLLTMKPL